MSYSCLQSFLQHLEQIGELRRITQFVSPFVEVTKLAQLEATSKSPTQSDSAGAFDPGREQIGGQALFIENITGCDFPLVINTFGSYFRMEQAFGGSGFEDIAGKISQLANAVPPSGISELLSMAKQFKPLLNLKPKRIKKNALCQQVVKRTEDGEVNLQRLPIIKCWPLDGDPRSVGYDFSSEDSGTANGGGRFITFAGMHTIHADDRNEAKPKSHNIGMYRAQLLDETHLAMHWHIHHDGAAHWRSWKAIGKPMPIAICLGGETVLPYAATCPLPPGMSELLMAGYLHGKGIALVRAKTVPLWVPANSEIVIEGYVSTACGYCDWEPGDEPLGEGAVFEGPFGDHTGFYSMPDRYPIVDVTAVTHRENAVYPTIVVGPPPQEDYYLGKATERIMLPLLKVLMPDIIDYHLPMFGTFHNCVFVQIKPAYAEHARKVMCGIWGAGQLAWTKMIVVVNDTVDVHNERAVFEAMSGIDIHNDIEVVRGPLDILDHAAPAIGAGGKIGIDATASKAGTYRADAIQIITIEKKQGGDGATALETAHKNNPNASMIFAVDNGIDTTKLGKVFFNFAACFDPTRDMHYFENCIGFDGTTKQCGDERNGKAVRPWPPALVLDDCD